jgi:hypothetical protein
MIVTWYPPQDDNDDAKRMRAEISDLLEAPLSPEAQDLLDSLPTRYEPHDTRFAAWVGACVARAQLPAAAAHRLIDDAKLDLLDVYPNVADGEMVICPADLSTWSRSHPFQEPRQTLTEWWESLTK